MRARHRAILRSSTVAKYISTVSPSVRTQVSSRVGIKKIVRTGHHYSREKKEGSPVHPSKRWRKKCFLTARTIAERCSARRCSSAIFSVVPCDCRLWTYHRQTGSNRRARNDRFMWHLPTSLFSEPQLLWRVITDFSLEQRPEWGLESTMISLMKVPDFDPL